MKIEVLGTGCAKCSKLEENVMRAADEVGNDYVLTKISDLKEIMNYGVAVTPALVVDGAVKSSGVVPSVEELKEILES